MPPVSGAGSRARRAGGAEDTLVEKLREVRSPALVRVAHRATVDEFSKRWQDILVVNVKRRTLESYTQTLDNHPLPALGKVRLDRLGRAAVRKLLIDKMAAARRRWILPDGLETLPGCSGGAGWT